ncbi:MAG: hypothetical protein P8Z37_06430 [Acidobacteriota bacterium]
MLKIKDFRSSVEYRYVCRFPQKFKSGDRLITATILLAAFFQFACIFGGGDKAVVMPTAPIRIAFLPFNTPVDSTDLQYTSMASPIMMALIVRNSQSMEPVPLWESMRFTMESVRNSRTIGAGNAAYVANWLNADWAVMGSLSKEGTDKVSLMIDFIPARDTSVPFRYLKNVKMDAVDENVRKAFNQFLNYISSPQMENTRERHLTFVSLRQLAEVMNKEYGWTVAAEPGKAEETVNNLVKSDPWLARFLFNPTLYAALENQ